MAGLSESLKQFNKVLWPDASLEAAILSYDEIVIHVLETSGTKRTIRCCGFIGVEYFGIWDEIVIESAQLRETDEFIKRCQESISARIGDPAPDSGSIDRNARQPLALTLKMSDGCVLNIALNRLEVE